MAVSVLSSQKSSWDLGVEASTDGFTHLVSEQKEQCALAALDQRKLTGSGEIIIFNDLNTIAFLELITMFF